MNHSFKDLDRIKADFIADRVSIHRVSVAVKNVIWNNLPDKTAHPADLNEIDRITNALSGKVELIEFTELEENHKKEVILLFEEVKEKMIFISENYPKRGKEFWLD